MPRAKKPSTEEKAPDLQWNDVMEAALFNAFLEQQNRGKRADMGWKSEAWMDRFLNVIVP
jgi:hypothetical protein